jgi:tetratricopeptide (TPR) repeat protein
LGIYREQVKNNPETYRPAVARTLNDLGILHSHRNRYAEARAAYEEAVSIDVEFAAATPNTSSSVRDRWCVRSNQDPILLTSAF